MSSATARQIAGALVALMFAGVQLGTAVHVAMVEHVRCAEHGDLVEIKSAAAPAQGTAPDTHGVAPGRATTSAHAGHDHCTLMAAGRAPALLDSSRALETPLAPRVLPPAAAVFAHSPIDQSALAPKTSPPQTTVS